MTLPSSGPAREASQVTHFHVSPEESRPVDWKQYEHEIYQHFVTTFPSAQVTKDMQVMGRHSQVERQVDVLIEDAIAGFRLRIAVDAKHRNKRIDVTDVEAFIGYCADIGASKGVLISLKGYTPAAANRAHHDDSDIELDVLNFSELKQFQAFAAFPYAGDNGVVLTAPFGWVIDGTKRKEGVATIYQRGYDLKAACLANEWMYCNFWAKDSTASSLGKLIKHQEAYLRADFPTAKITYLNSPKRESSETTIRCFVEKTYPATEYTGFIEFKDFIFFCVLFSPPELANRNVRKLEHVLRTVMPIKVSQNAA